MFELVVPAHNEERHVGKLVRWARSAFGATIRIVVIDNASVDRTAQVALAAGADEILNEPRLGKGFAVISGLKRCESHHVMLCDADIVGLNPEALMTLRDLTIKSGSPVGRLSLDRTPEDAPVTTLLALPLLSALGVAGRTGCEPLGGLMIAERTFLFDQHLPGGWGFDVACTLAAAKSGRAIPELPVRGVTHRHKPLIEYVDMAREVCLAVLRATGSVPWDHTDCTRCPDLPALEDHQPGARMGKLMGQEGERIESGELRHAGDSGDTLARHIAAPG